MKKENEKINVNVNVKSGSKTGSFVAGAVVGAAVGGGAAYASTGKDLDDLKELFVEDGDTKEVVAAEINEEDEVVAEIQDDAEVEADERIEKLEGYINDMNQQTIDELQANERMEKLENYVNDINAEAVGEVEVEPVEEDDIEPVKEISFNEAFAAARSEMGPGGVFEWNGKLYNTYYSEEWSAMSDEEKAEFQRSIYNDEEAETPMPYDNVEPEVVPEQEEVSVYAEYDAEHDVYAGKATFEGKDVILVDLDGDAGEFDVALADVNDDGIITHDEIIDLTGGELPATELDIYASNEATCGDDCFTDDVCDEDCDIDTPDLA